MVESRKSSRSASNSRKFYNFLYEYKVDSTPLGGAADGTWNVTVTLRCCLRRCRYAHRTVLHIVNLIRESDQRFAVCDDDEGHLSFHQL